MRKEVLFAILLGTIIGLAIAFGAWRANKALKTQDGATEPKATQPPSNEENKKSESNQVAQLILTAPENNSIVGKEQINIEGAASPEAIIVITTSSQEAIAQADKDGVFKQEIELKGGANEIKAQAFDKDGNGSEQTLTVVYSTEFGVTE